MASQESTWAHQSKVQSAGAWKLPPGSVITLKPRERGRLRVAQARRAKAVAGLRRR